MRAPAALTILLAAACAATGDDRWGHASEVFRDGDVVACLDAVRSKSGVELRWVGARAEGGSRLSAVRMILFCDANGDLAVQPEEQLTRWNVQAEQPVGDFQAATSFEATNLKPDVLEAMCVFTEVTVAGRPEPLRQTRRLP